MNSVLVDFVDNTIEYIRKDSDLLSAELVVPEVRTDFAGRHALIVVRGYHYKEDLAILASYIREYRPLLIGVDGGDRLRTGERAQQHGQRDQLDEHEQRSGRQQPLGRPARERGERDDVVHARGQQHEEHAHEQRVVVGHEPTQPEHHRRHRQERRQQEQREDRLDEHRPRARPGHGPPDDGARGDPGGG